MSVVSFPQHRDVWVCVCCSLLCLSDGCSFLCRCVCVSVRLQLHVCCLWCLHRTHVKSVVKNQKAYINHPFLSLCVSGPTPNSCCRTSCWWTSSAGPVQCGAFLNTLMLQHCSGHSYMLPFCMCLPAAPSPLRSPAANADEKPSKDDAQRWWG